ncbi:MAG: hypothetical protein SFV17_12410 [Candidatus Obscuribacter sp.]|nr:hypothetical protein [Candidatus Obscuribacter sp.]
MTEQVFRKCSLLLSLAAWMTMPNQAQASEPLERRGEESDRVFLPGNFFTPAVALAPSVKRKPSLASVPSLEQLKLIESLTADQSKRLNELFRDYKSDISALQAELKGSPDAAAKASLQARISFRQNTLMEALKVIVKTEQMDELERKKKGMTSDSEVENLP